MVRTLSKMTFGKMLLRMCPDTLRSFTGHLEAYASTGDEIWMILYRPKKIFVGDTPLVYFRMTILEGGQNWPKITLHMLLNMYKSYKNTSLTHLMAKYNDLCHSHTPLQKPSSSGLRISLLRLIGLIQMKKSPIRL